MSKLKQPYQVFPCFRPTGKIMQNLCSDEILLRFRYVALRLQGETSIGQAFFPCFQGRRLWDENILLKKRRQFEVELSCKRWIYQLLSELLPILFETARERAKRSAMEGLEPAKKLGHPSTRAVKAFVTWEWRWWKWQRWQWWQRQCHGMDDHVGWDYNK